MLAHHLVAQAARERLSGSAARLLVGAADAYKVGAQGPDFLFYSHVWPLQRGRDDLAFLVHRHHTSDVFRAMLAGAADLPPGDRGAAYAFACGYAAHLCLDAVAHPWILYWTGDITTGTQAGSGAAAMRRHGVFEASIDVTLSRRRSPDTGWIRRQCLLALPGPQRDMIARLWSGVMDSVYEVSFTAAEGRAAFRDMAFVYGAMSDPRSLLSRLVEGLAPRTDAGAALRGQVYPREPHPTAAALLRARRPWRHPSMPDEVRTQTFAEIWETAVMDTVRSLEGIAAVAAGTKPIEAAVEAIGDRDMITGVPCEDKRPLAAFAAGVEELWGQD